MIQKIVDEKYHLNSMLKPQSGFYAGMGILNALDWEWRSTIFNISDDNLLPFFLPMIDDEEQRRPENLEEAQDEFDDLNDEDENNEGDTENYPEPKLP